ncbi:MAG TPA: hypothetical protein VM285_14705, partial [Polyangia bacterium]|nr:hypothetical protein [Polyangia bacterium]
MRATPECRPVPTFAAVAILAAVALPGCGPRFVDARTFARNTGLDPDLDGSLWEGFAPGARVMVAPSAAGGCTEQWAETREGLETGPAPLEGSQLAAVSTIRTVASALIKAEAGGYLALALDDDAGGRVWVMVPGGLIPRCVWPLDD